MSATTERTPDNDPMVRECLKDGVGADDILLIFCPFGCGLSFYSGGFTSGCTWCGREIAAYSDEAISLADYWGRELPDEAMG